MCQNGTAAVNLNVLTLTAAARFVNLNKWRFFVNLNERATFVNLNKKSAIVNLNKKSADPLVGGHRAHGHPLLVIHFWLAPTAFGPSKSGIHF